jgi:hypothetical protein
MRSKSLQNIYNTNLHENNIYKYKSLMPIILGMLKTLKKINFSKAIN